MPDQEMPLRLPQFASLAEGDKVIVHRVLEHPIWFNRDACPNCPPDRIVDPEQIPEVIGEAFISSIRDDETRSGEVLAPQMIVFARINRAIGLIFDLRTGLQSVSMLHDPMTGTPFVRGSTRITMPTNKEKQ